MKQNNNLQELKELCSGGDHFSTEVLARIEQENLWNIWVPESYCGLGLSFTEGLKRLKHLAKTDGSLGWTVTLCSGANYFIGNLTEEAAREVFLTIEAPVLGGSGAVSGTAEKLGDQYRISGLWRYATGAPYLTHFTLNAEILENGSPLKNDDGSPVVRSFIIPKDAVDIIEDWNAMGLKASATHSFRVEKAMVHEKFSFLYNEVHLPQDIFRIDFSVFADLTLWVNYLGMAAHFAEEARNHGSAEKLDDLEQAIRVSDKKLFRYAADIEQAVAREKGSEAEEDTSTGEEAVTGNTLSEDYRQEIHCEAAQSVKNLSRSIIELYPFLGVKASREDHPLNRVFCDYFTATQHHIFTGS